MKSIYDYTLKEIEELLISNGYKKYNATQVFDWLYKKKVTSFDEMSNLKKELRSYLKENFQIGNLTLEKKQVSKDNTVKFLFKLKDTNIIETVLMRHDYGNSICITSQIGCNMGCSFCASGLHNKKRNLEVSEMVDQILTVEDLTNIKVSHIVVMGIGEPFDNYQNVMKFVRIVNSPKGLEIGARHITISTSGIVPKIMEFANEGIQVNLAISLHASNDSLRTKIMKINEKYSINEVISACNYYIEKTNRRVTFEYILLDHINDETYYADELSDLIRGMNVYVNLIPYNPVNEFSYKKTSKQRAFAFYDRLKKRGINCTLRKEQGGDIDAACGQLRSENI